MRQSSLQKSGANVRQASQSPVPIHNERSTVTPVTPVYQPPKNTMTVSNGIQQNSREYNEALQANQNLKDEMDNLINGQTEFGLSNNVVKLSHYNLSQADMA